MQRGASAPLPSRSDLSSAFGAALPAGPLAAVVTTAAYFVRVFSG